MYLEVEQKFRVSDWTDLERRLVGLGAVIEEPVAQRDLYFAHPSRDFAQTDEALRIRRVGERNFVTYKGPKLDSTTKTRRELELPLASGDEAAARFAELLAALGFRLVREVRKQRRRAIVRWQGREIEAALDEVDGVGRFAELELQADEAEADTARALLASLAAELHLDRPERRSYLELLLAADTKVGDWTEFRSADFSPHEL